MCLGGVFVRLASVALLTLTAISLSGSPAIAGGGGAEAAARRSSTGTLVVRIAGLPRGERGLVIVTGPRQSSRHGKRLPRGKRFRQPISRLGTVRLRGLPTGAYRLRVRPVTMRHRHGTIRRGAAAVPLRRKLKLRLGSRRAGRITARYGTIRNPGVKTLRAKVIGVVGNPLRPRGLVVRGRQLYRPGIVLSGQPSASLPRGLLARVKGSRRRGKVTRLALRSASIYEVAPNMHFRTRLHVRGSATTSASLSCAGGSGVTPFIRISDAMADGSWTTSRVWPFGEIKTGARVNLAFDVGAGVDVASVLGGSCQLTLPGFTLQGFAGGIPIYGSIKPVLVGSAGVGARLKAEGKVRITAGATISAVPPSAAPSVGIGAPQFVFSDEVFADVGLGFGIRSEIGLGVDDVANLHAAFGNNLEFNVGGGACRWDLRLGTFSAGGKLGRFGISTPSTPPLYQHNLWQAPCLPPPLVAPLLRAQAVWGTDADVDLYAWDEAGHQAYFVDRDAIPGAELVEDVIPGEAEIVHDPERSVENQSLGRRLTFGLCLFRGDPTSVTLTVPFMPDPRGPASTYQVPLHSEGEGVVVATSPAGPGFTPPPGWCRSVAD